MSRTATGATYPTINTVGALLPPDLLTRLANGELDHLTPGTYGLPETFTLRQAAARAWELLLPTYRSFQTRLAALPEGDPATTVTRDRWTTVLLRELGYDLKAIPNITIDDDTFDVRHLDGHVPIHMLGWNVDLDKRAATNIRGASRTAPHSLIQELLNRTDAHLWAILTNGKRLRLLRDNIVMGRPAYIEFDLEGMFTGEQFADFAILYALAHATRLRSDEPADCILEQWRNTAINDGTRALEHLRDGVVEALKTLGNGFLEHPDNADLRDLLKGNHGATDDYYRWLLRIVYRLIFLFVAEDRDLLHPEDTPTNTRQRYADYFSSQHLRNLATRKRAGRHADAWAALRLVFDALGNDGEPALGLPAYGSDLFSPGFIGTLNDAKISNDRFLDAIRSLSQLPDRATGTLRPVDYKNLGSEELGSVYEALLEYVPTLTDGGHTFTLCVLGGNARKTTGSYYTPSELVELLLDETLDPVLDTAASSEHPVEALLAVTVCDPACGSGHFLVAAARRIARRLATARTGDPEPTPDDMREALRDVVAHCIYGVDLSDLAAELAKVSLWLESLTPGQPLAFLDAHIKVGNALYGTTPALLAQNVPDIAFQPLEGDDDPCDICSRKGITERITAREAKRGAVGCSHTPWSTIVRNANRAQRQDAEAQQDTLMGVQQVYVSNTAFAKAAEAVEDYDPTDIESVRKQADAWQRAEQEPTLKRAKEVADSWCASFVWRLSREHARNAPTHEILLTLQDNENLAPLRATRDEVARLARKYRFFHWHLEFPHLFKVEDGTDTSTGWTGGFSCMIGNPPWERLKVQDEEFFAAAGRDDIVKARTAAVRRKMIESLIDEDPALYRAYLLAQRDADGVSHFVRTSGVYPLTGRGDVNTFQVFAEQFTTLTGAGGRSALVCPTAIATGSTTAEYFSSLVTSGRLRALYDFENEAKIFPSVHHAFRFCVLAASSDGDTGVKGRFAFLVRHISTLAQKRFALSPEEILLINPNTGTCPTFASRRDAEIVLGMYRKHPVLVAEDDPNGNPWDIKFGTQFHMANDSDKFHTQKDLEDAGASFDGFAYAKGGSRWLPLYEAKMFGHYDHRFSTYRNATQANLNNGTLPRPTDAEHDQPDYEVLAGHWVRQSEVKEALAGWPHEWLLGWRNITGATVYRTLIPSLMPATATAHSILLAQPRRSEGAHFILAAWSSLAVDYISRQKLSGSNFVYHVMRQIAVPHPDTFAKPEKWTGAQTLGEWVTDRLLELVYTSDTMAPFAEDQDDNGRPFRWIPERRAALQAELDAAMFHVYGVGRDDVEHIMTSFGVMQRAEERDMGEYRTRRLVLEAYDAMSQAAAAGQQFVSPLCPAPGLGPRHA